MSNTVEISKKEAVSTLAKALPGYRIQAGPVAYEDLWLYTMVSDDPLEGQMDIFYSVNRMTGVFSGFSILEDPGKFIGLFSKSVRHSADDFLAHYGVRGMQWGVINGAPGSSTTSNSSKKSGPSGVSKSVELGLNVAKPMLNMVVPRANLMSHAVNVGMTAFAASKAGALSMSAVTKALKSDLLSPMAAVGLAVSVADSGAYRVPVMAIKNQSRGGWPKDPSLAKPDMSLSDIQKKVVSGVNPDFPGLGTTNNCVRATYSYEMRRRGFNVSATKTIFATGQAAAGQAVAVGTLRNTKNRIASSTKRNPISSLVKGNRPSAADVMSRLSSEPDRSRGELQMSWGLGAGGHSVAYEIIGGKPVVIDSQSGKSYSTPAELTKLTSSAATLNYTRLDNKPLNQLALTSFLKDGD